MKLKAQKEIDKVMKINQNKRSKYWLTMCDILDGQFPKGKCAERGRALVMLAFIEMMLLGTEFGEDGHPQKPI